MCKKLICLANLVLLLALAPLVCAQTYPGKIGVGAGIVWVDLAKDYRYTKADGTDLTSGNVDANGWPTCDAQYVYDGRPVAEWAGSIDDPQQYRVDMSGTYKCSFTGQATLTRAEGPYTIANQVYNSGTNTTTFDIIIGAPGPHHGLIVLKFTNTKRTSGSATNTGFTNLKVIRPGYPLDTTQLFDTPYLDCLNSASFAALRGCGSAYCINGTYPAVREWSDRRKTTDAGQSGDIPGRMKDGAAWEYVVQFVNTVHKDAWIHVPVDATDNYVTQLATLLKNNLDSALNLYVEYDNEVWNWGFPQSLWNLAAANAAGLSYITQYAKRTVEVSNIFKNVWGASAINTRVRVVLCWQIGWWPPDGQQTEQLNYINATFGPPKNFIWGCGWAPYHNCDPVCTTGTVQQILDAMWANSNSSVTSRTLVINNANSWGLKSLCYEGGSDTGGGDVTNIANKIGAERASGMKDVYIHDLRDNWFPLGGDLFMYLAVSSGYNRYGSWGLTDDYHNPDRNYKFAAVRELLGDVPGLPGQASNPSPANGATGVSITADLSWTAGSGATSHDVYFGTANPPPFKVNQTGTSYDTGTMAYTTYYWRIDEKNAVGTTTGVVWSFSTLAGGTGTGLTGDYYDNMDFTNLKLTRTDPTINFDWGSGSPDPNIGADTFSVSWSGDVQPLYSETYTFYTTSDDGVRLWVNGQLIINNWTDHGTTVDSNTIALTAGTKYDIDMDYYENGGGAVAKLEWSSASQARQIIPQTQLYPVVGLPSPWQNQDIGSPSAAGSVSYFSGTFTVIGDGADIWGTSDSFQFVYQSLNGDGQIVARVATLQNTDGWAKAGVMIRESLTGGSTHAMAAVTPSNGVAFQRRTATDGSSSHTAGDAVTAPYWVKIVRSGSTFTASQSSNGTSWTTIGSETITMASSVYIGLAVTSHLAGTLCTATVDNVTVTTVTPPAAPTNLTATAGDAQVALSWNASAGADKYNVYRGTGGNYYLQASPTATSWTDTSVSNGTTYWYYVTAQNAAGESSPSNTVSATPQAAVPGQASNPSPANGATSVSITADLSWTAGSGATSHDVYFGTVSPGTFRGNQTGTTYDTGTMANSTTYYWRIDEKNASGTTTGVVWSFTTQAVTPPPSGQLLAWDFVGEGGVSSSTADSTDANISTTSPSGVASIGPGLTPMNYCDNGLTATDSTAMTLAAALSGNEYFTWSITPKSGYKMSLTSVDIRPVSQNRIRTFVLFSSINGFTEGSQIASFDAQCNTGCTVQTVPLSGHTDRTSAVEFRLYVYGYDNVYESVGMGNGDGMDLVVNGTTASTGGAATPTFVAAGAVSSGTAAITPALPAGLATNDILLLFLETANQAISISNQNGGTWTAVTNSPQGTGTAGGTSATRLTVYWSRYNGTQGAPTTSDSGNHQAGRMIALRGCPTSGNPWDVTAGGVESTSDTSGSIPGATTTVANTLVVAAIATDLPDATGTANFSAWANANLTGVTERTDDTRSSGNGGGLGIATGIKATAGAYGSTTVTCATSAVKGMMSIAIKGG